MAWIASTSQGTPYTCVARMAEVRGVIRSSMRAGSMLKVSGSMSTNTGVHPSQMMLMVVTGCVKAVVMISPLRSSARIARCSASVPLATNTGPWIPKRSSKAFSNSATRGPLLVTQPRSQTPRITSMNSSKGGMNGLVTGTGPRRGDEVSASTTGSGLMLLISEGKGE